MRGCTQRIKPDCVIAHYNLANALHDANELDQAIEHFNMVLQCEPENVDALFNMGVVLQVLHVHSVVVGVTTPWCASQLMPLLLLLPMSAAAAVMLCRTPSSFRRPWTRTDEPRGSSPTRKGSPTPLQASRSFLPSKGPSIPVLGPSNTHRGVVYMLPGTCGTARRVELQRMCGCAYVDIGTQACERERRC